MHNPVPLPIDAALPAIVQSVRSTGTCIVLASPGAGKTTRVPVALASANTRRGIHGKTLVLQPRRIAARSTAARIAHEQGWKLGDEIGYRIRFENRTRAGTHIVIITEGLLTRMLEQDPFLDGVATVILDEFHERNIHSDLALAMLQEVRSSVRPDLQIVVMSATLDPEPIRAFLGSAEVVNVNTPTFPVDVKYLPQYTSHPLTEKCTAAVSDVLADPFTLTGHILIFLHGMREINDVARRLPPAPGTEVHILHSSVPAADQDRALQPSATRKLILSTNIAETSLTIDGVRTVIDSGYARVPQYDSRLGIDRLELRRISKASATQRAGRAGRTGPGQCLRLWTPEEQAVLEDHATPEIHRVDLSQTILAIHAFGVVNLRDFRWFEPPAAPSLARAERLLWMLGALSADGRLTPLGRAMAEIPAHPRLARMLLAVIDSPFLPDAALLAAAISEDALDDFANGGDLLTVLDAPRSRFPRHLLDVQQHLLRAAGKADRAPLAMGPSPIRDIALRKAVLSGYPDRLTVRRSTDPARGTMVGGRGVKLAGDSHVHLAPLFISIDPRDTLRRDNTPTATESGVRVTSAVQREWLDELFPHLLIREEAAQYDPERDRVLGTTRTTFVDLVLEEKITGKLTAGAGKAMADFLTDPVRLRVFLGERPDSTTWLARLQFAAHHVGEAGFPHPDEAWLLTQLAHALESKTSLAGLRDHELLNHLQGTLPYKQLQELDRLAPRTITAPTGTHVKLQYPEWGGGEADKPPIAAVRLQELFGLAESPRVADGRVTVLLHLLAPNYRPAQVTTDLASFWKNTYPEVRKELRGRYPKHPWPDNPLTAPPVSVGRRRM